MLHNRYLKSLQATRCSGCTPALIITSTAVLKSIDDVDGRLLANFYLSYSVNRDHGQFIDETDENKFDHFMSAPSNTTADIDYTKVVE